MLARAERIMSDSKRTPGQVSSSASASTTRLTPEQRQRAWENMCLKVLAILDYMVAKRQVEAKLGPKNYLVFFFCWRPTRRPAKLNHAK